MTKRVKQGPVNNFSRTICGGGVEDSLSIAVRMVVILPQKYSENVQASSWEGWTDGKGVFLALPIKAPG